MPPGLLPLETVRLEEWRWRERIRRRLCACCICQAKAPRDHGLHQFWVAERTQGLGRLGGMIRPRFDHPSSSESHPQIQGQVSTLLERRSRAGGGLQLEFQQLGTAFTNACGSYVRNRNADFWPRWPMLATRSQLLWCSSVAVANMSSSMVTSASVAYDGCTGIRLRPSVRRRPGVDQHACHALSCPTENHAWNIFPGLGSRGVRKRIPAGREFQDAVREVLTANAEFLIFSVSSPNAEREHPRGVCSWNAFSPIRRGPTTTADRCAC